MSDRDLDLVREALDYWAAYFHMTDDDARMVSQGRAALSRLEERLATAERERDEALAKWQELEHPFDKSEYDGMFERASQLAEALEYLANWDPIKATVLGSDDFRLIARHALAAATPTGQRKGQRDG